MSDKRVKYLSTVVKVTLAVGIFLVAIPFFGSLRPSQVANELNHFERIDVADIDKNTSRIIQARPSKEWKEGDSTRLRPGRAWLIIRDNTGVFRVFGVPTWEGSILMGRSFWGQFEGLCNDLGPASGANVIDAGTEIRCNDEDNDSYFAPHWQWTIDGRNISREIVDLPLIRSELQQTDLAIFDPVWNLD